MSRNIRDMITKEAQTNNADWVSTAKKFKEDFLKEGLYKSAEHVDKLIKEQS